MKNLLLLALTLLTLTACIKKDCEIPNDQYEFEIPATLSPAKVTYKIGDTISVISRFPHQVYERNTQRTYDLADYIFNPTLSIWEVSTEEIIKTVLNEFEVIVDTSIYNFYKYEFSSTETTIYEGNYSNKNGEYILEYKFIPTRTGLYMFGQSNFTSNSRKHQSFPGKCDSATSGARVRLNAGQNNNPQFLLNSENEYLRTNIYQRQKNDFNGFGSFMFYVQE